MGSSPMTPTCAGHGQATIASAQASITYPHPALWGREATDDSRLALCWQRTLDVSVNRPQVLTV